MRRLAAFAALLGLMASSPAAGGEIEAALDPINKHFKKTHFVALIPLAAGQTRNHKIIVTPDGKLDIEQYRRQIGQSGVSFQPGDSGKRIYFNPKPKNGVILVALLKKRFPKAVVAIDYQRPLRLDDITREKLVRALANLIEIEGEAVPTDFDPEAFAEFLAGDGTDFPQITPLQTPPPTPPTAPQATQTVESAMAYDPALDVLSAEVEPVRVKPGMEIRLQIHFELTGVPQGRQVPITVERQVFYEDEPLFEVPQSSTEDWPAGRHTSTTVLPVPTDAPAGVFRLEVTVRGAGSEQRQEALFVVE